MDMNSSISEGNKPCHVLIYTKSAICFAIVVKSVVTNNIS